jgi:hypothetical protein
MKRSYLGYTDYYDRDFAALFKDKNSLLFVIFFPDGCRGIWYNCSD